MSDTGLNTVGHNLLIYDRGRFSVTGVKSVDSFDESQIVLTLADSELTIEGDGLNITELDSDRGRVEATGRVSGVFYGDGVVEKKGFFSRLVKG